MKMECSVTTRKKEGTCKLRKMKYGDKLLGMPNSQVVKIGIQFGDPNSIIKDGSWVWTMLMTSSQTCIFCIE